MAPQIYVADLAAYNYGSLRGVWIEFAKGTEAEEVRAEITELLEDSDGDEWRIDDTEGFAEFKSSDLEKLCQVAALINQHGETPVRGFFNNRGDDEDPDSFGDYYRGCYESEEEFMQEICSHIDSEAEKIQVFEWATLDKYIDWESIAHDAFINDYYSYSPKYQEVHVYTRN